MKVLMLAVVEVEVEGADTIEEAQEALDAYREARADDDKGVTIWRLRPEDLARFNLPSSNWTCEE